MWLLDLLGGKHKNAPASTMLHQAETPHSEGSGDFPDINMEEIDPNMEIDPLCGQKTLVFFEDGTSRSSDHKYIDTQVAASLLHAPIDRFFTHNTVEMKYYYDMAPKFKVYLLRNRVMLKENKGLWRHLHIREKGPVVVCHIDSIKPLLIKPTAMRIPTQANDSVSPPIEIYTPETDPISLPIPSGVVESWF